MKNQKSSNRILLVDDEETLRCVLRETLIDEGYSVDVAKDGFQALERLKLVTYDLLITDIKMHGMDGFQLIRNARRNNSNLKVIIITAYGSLEMVKDAVRLGVVELISKPFKIQEIKDVIIRALNNHGISKDIEKNKINQPLTGEGEQLSNTDNLLIPNGLSYHFDGPACQPKSTVVFDSFAISNNRSMLIFGNINDQGEQHRGWWENRQIGIMIKTLFRSRGNTPKKIVDSINNFLYKNILPHIKVSVLCALVDKRKRVIKYVNCGDNMVCSMIAPYGKTEIMESLPSPLGVSPRINLIEKTMTYSYENKLMLSRSNSISQIMEKGIIIKQTIENALQYIKGSQRERSKEIDLRSSFVNNEAISFDDETVLLIDLDRSYTTRSVQSEKSKPRISLP